MRLGAGARAVAMGEAYTALADDASAVYWNPAGMTGIEKRSATFMHAAYLDSISFEYAAYAQQLPREFGVVGASIHYLSAGDVMEVDPSGVEQGAFRPYDMAVTIAYAYRLEEREAAPADYDRPVDEWRWLRGYTVGLAAKFVYSKISAADRTQSFDIGLRSPEYLDERLRFALVAQNIGGVLKYDQEREVLPFVGKAGVSFKYSDQVLCAVEGVVPWETSPYGAVGAEYRRVLAGRWSGAGRVGFSSKTLGEVSGATGLSAGVGLAYEKYSLDYGFVPLGTLGLTHQVSVTARF